jgi:hypothetical protein
VNRAARDLQPGDTIRVQGEVQVVDRSETFRDSNGYWFLYIYFTGGGFIMKALNDQIEMDQ